MYKHPKTNTETNTNINIFFFFGKRFLKSFSHKSSRFTEFLKYRSSPPEKFLRKGVLKICSKFTGEYPCQSAISIKLICIFIEITLLRGCSPVNLLQFSENLWRAVSGNFFCVKISLYIFLSRRLNQMFQPWSSW